MLPGPTKNSRRMLHGGGDPHDIIQVTPLEEATNEIWFATPENTQNLDTLDHFNRRVYDLIIECREKEKLDPTSNDEARKAVFRSF